MSNKKKINKFAASSMVATAAVAAIAPAVSADTINYTDVQPGDSHYEGIKALTEQGVVQGYEDGSFGINDNVTRQQVAVMLAGSLDLETPSDVAGVLEVYSDIDENSIYAEQIAAVTKAGIFNGNNGEFNPGDDITREQMATVLVLGLDLADYDTTKDVDVNLDNVSASHDARVQVLANLEITNQLDDFGPEQAIRRGQFSTMLYLAQQTVDVEDTIVESVNAVNATEVEVTFNQPVGNAAKLLDSYTLVDKTNFSPQEVSSVELSEDMKTATLTVATLSDDTNYVLRFNNFTDAVEESIDLDDAEVTTDFPDAEPTIQSSQVEILRNGDDASNVTGMVAVNLPEGFTLASPSTNVDVEDSSEVSVLGTTATENVNAANQLIINLGGDDAGAEVELTSDKTYTVTFAAGSLTNEYNISNTEEVTVDFVATEAELAVPQVTGVDVAESNNAGTALTLSLNTDIPVSVANDVVGYLIDDKGKTIDLTAKEIQSGNEDTEVELTGAIVAGDVEAGKQYTVVISSDSLTSVLGETNETYQTSVTGVDTTAPKLQTAELVSESKAVFTFDENVSLVDSYSVSFAGVTFDGTEGNVATVSGNTLTLTSEDRSITTDSSAGLVLNAAGQLENSAGVDVTYNENLLADDEDATNDSANQSFLVDNATASFIDATITDTTISFTFSEDVTDVNADADEGTSVLVDGVEYSLDLSGKATTATLDVSGAKNTIEAGDTVYVAPSSVKSVSEDESLPVINTTLGE